MTFLQNEYHKSNDAELWKRFIKGDLHSFEELFNAHFTRLFRFGMTLIPDEAIVKDCIQNLFIDLWEKRDHLPSIEQIRPYLFKSLRNRIYNQHKAEKRQAEFIKTLQSQDLIGIVPEDQEEIASSMYDQTQLKTLVNELPIRQREAIMLIFFEECSYEKTSEILSINIKSLYTLISRAVASLRSNLKRP